MKKLKVIALLLVAALLLPIGVFAEEETTATEPSKVTVYFFRGEGCSHCAEAEEWFNSIQEEYGSYFKVVDYETWYNTENAELMQKVAKARGEEATGVPYIIIGNKSWNGFAQDYAPEMIQQITSEYNKAEKDRYDIMKYLTTGDDKDEDSGSDIIPFIIILVVVGGICFGVYKARSKVK